MKDSMSLGKIKKALKKTKLWAIIVSASFISRGYHVDVPIDERRLSLKASFV